MPALFEVLCRRKGDLYVRSIIAPSLVLLLFSYVVAHGGRQPFMLYCDYVVHLLCVVLIVIPGTRVACCIAPVGRDCRRLR